MIELLFTAFCLFLIFGYPIKKFGCALTFVWAIILLLLIYALVFQ